MKRIPLILIVIAFASSAFAAKPEKAIVHAVRGDDRAPLDYEGMFDIAHWQFTIRQRSVRDVKIALYLDGKELLTSELSEQTAHSSKPHILDVAIAPFLGSLLVKDKWQVGLSLRGHASFSTIIPRPHGLENMGWDAPRTPELAPNRFELARIFDNKEDSRHRHPRHLVLQVRINQE